MDAQLLVYMPVYREKFFMENYIGSNDIFALVKSGSFTFSCGEGIHTVQENQGALFRKDVLYHRQVLSPVTMYLFRYQAEAPVFPEDKIVFTDTHRIASTMAFLDRLDSGIYKNEFQLRQDLFIDILTQYTIENAAQLPEKNTDNDPIAKAATYITKNLHKKIYLAQIAEKAGLSYVQFIRRFKAATDMTPSEYVFALRLQKARSLLTQTRLPIRQIANACGFENEYYFSNFFKKHTGFSPSAFRKETIE